MSKSTVRLGLLGGLTSLALIAPAGLAQSDAKPAAGTTAAAAPARQTTGDPRRDTLLRMQKPVTIELSDTPLEEVMKYLSDLTQADIEPQWTSDTEGDGLSKDSKVTMSVKGMPAILFLEKLGAHLDGGAAKYTWQMDPEGVLQYGPKARLNKYKRVEIYDINDLLFILPVYDNAPQIDLNQVLQQAGRGGGGGGSSPFRENQGGRGGQQDEPPTKEERAKNIIKIVTATAEPEEWADGGGEGGTITYHEGTMIVNAADYLHRALNGYKWWPSFRASTSGAGKRYVQLNQDVGIAQLERPIRSFPTSAVVGGRVVTSPPGGG